jgi:hypothetical protein
VSTRRYTSYESERMDDEQTHALAVPKPVSTQNASDPPSSIIVKSTAPERGD